MDTLQRFLTTLGAIALLAPAACGKADDAGTATPVPAALLGTWEGPNGSIELASDGRVKVGESTGSYVVLPDGRLQMTMGGATTTWAMDPKNDVLTLTEGTKRVIYARVATAPAIQVAWRHALDGAAPHEAAESVFAADGTVCVHTSGQRVLQFEPVSGRVLRTFDQVNQVISIRDGVLSVVGRAGCSGWSLKDGRRVWAVSAEGRPFDGRLARLTDDGRIVAARSGRVECLDLASGRVVWEHVVASPGPQALWCTRNSIVFVAVGGVDRSLVRLSAVDGHRLWSVKLPARLDVFQGMPRDEGLLLSTSQGLTMFDWDGRERWSLVMHAPDRKDMGAKPRLVAVGSRVIVGVNGAVAQIAPLTGAIEWHRVGPHALGTLEPSAEEIVVAGYSDGRPEGPTGTPPPFVVENMGRGDPMLPWLFAIDPASGRTNWAFAALGTDVHVAGADVFVWKRGRTDATLRRVKGGALRGQFVSSLAPSFSEIAVAEGMAVFVRPAGSRGAPPYEVVALKLQ